MTSPCSWIIINCRTSVVTYHYEKTQQKSDVVLLKSEKNQRKADVARQGSGRLSHDVQNVWHNWEDAE